LSEFLCRKVAPVNREETTLKQLNVIAKITFGGELHVRSEAAKKGYKGPLFYAHPGDLVISKIRVAQGSLCLVPDDVTYLAVSAEYPVYSVDTTRMRAQFIRLVICSSAFQQRVSRLRSGNTTKARIRPAEFEALRVPVPTLPKQDALIASYMAALNQAAQLEQDGETAERTGLHTFETALGVAPPPPLPDLPLFVARFKDIERWSHEGILDKSVMSSADNSAERFPQVALRDVVADLVNGWSPKCLTRSAKHKEWGVLKLGAVSFGEYDELQNKALPAHLKPKPELEVNQGDVLISRANVIRLVGACALVRETRLRLMLCDKIFRVVFQESSPIDPEFLGELIKLPTVRQQIEAAATGTSPTMKNISKPALLALTFPLPQGPDGIKTQQKLIAVLRLARESAASCRLEAKRLRAEAWATFESTLFNAVETSPSAASGTEPTGMVVITQTVRQ
jgi:type I restriction enzyme, S subunit